MTARMAVDLGFSMGMLAGSVSAMAILGAPDKILITAGEFADLAHRICRAADLCLVVEEPGSQLVDIPGGPHHRCLELIGLDC